MPCMISVGVDEFTIALVENAVDNGVALALNTEVRAKKAYIA
jgi:L-2-hydroxyglutarate oxidase LhgO